jgi:tRNA modification GTPase
MNASPPESPTYLAHLTPAGSGALASLALRGPRAWAVVREVFRRAGGRDLPAEPEAGTFWPGRLGEEGRGGSDEVVLAVRRGGPAPWLEVHCHGGREVVGLLEEVLAARGLQTVSWEELEARTAGPPLRAAAAAALARAATARTAAILLDQYHGAFTAAVEAARAALGRDDVAEAARALGELAARAPLGRHLTQPWKVAVAGPPNVGKSSLVNALAGYRRSVVAPTPGTTRDVVTVRVAVDGWPVELADTAGWREGAGGLETQGIDRGRAASGQADLCLWVLDASAEPVWSAADLPRARPVLNKVDLPAAWDLSAAGEVVRVSALTGAGLDELRQALARWLVPEVPPVGAAVPFTDRLCAEVEEARRLCVAGDARQAEHVVAGLLGEERR